MLAQWRAPAEIRDHFKAEHDVDLPIRNIIAYDPMSLYFAAGDKWRDLHTKARETFVAATMQHSIANQSFRLNELSDLYKQAKKRGNHVLAAQLMKQAAEEVGGAFTNERNVNLKRDAPEDADDRRRLVRDMIAEAVGKAKGEVEGTGTVQ